jgi:hypothetical protein
MQALSILGHARPTVPPDNSGGSSPTFALISPPRKGRWPGFALSVVLHVLGVLLLPVLTILAASESDQTTWMRHQRIVATLRIRVPELFYIASAGLKPKPDKKFLTQHQTPKQSQETPKAPPKLAQTKKDPPRRKFELPALQRLLNTTQTILQAQFAPDMTQPTPIRLPEVFFWAPRKDLPKFVKPFVEPGHEAQPSQPRLLDAPPKLELPATEPNALTIPPVPDSYQAMKLMKQPSLPVQTSQAQGGVPQTGISGDQTHGDPTTLFSLAVDPPPMRELLSVPPGNQLGQLPDAGPSGPSTLTGASGGGGTGSGSSLTGDENGAVNGADVAALRAMALAVAAATRINHPAGGVFDVVVESAGTAGFVESSGVLSGKPIYSVYIRAGGGRDWLMQYCIPPEDDVVMESTARGQIVRLTTSSPLVAPYPRMTMRPPVRVRQGRHVMVHGYITIEGRFRDLRVLASSGASEAEMVLAVLEQWQFRPASRDGKPLPVEILLAIPSD